MRKKLVIAGALVLLGAARAEASIVTPIDLAGGDVALTLGPTTLGVDVSLGRLILGASTIATALPGVVSAYGALGRVGWRLSGLPGRELTLGVALTGLVGSASGYFGLTEGYLVQPALVGALPLGRAAVLRASLGPVLFSGVYAAPGSTRGGGTGVWPVVPGLELAFQLGGSKELTLGGLPELISWRSRF